MSNTRNVDALQRLGAGAVGEIVENSPALQAAIAEERGDEKPASKLDWLPILIELGEDVLTRLLDKSPDAASAIAEARENFTQAEVEADALRREGH